MGRLREEENIENKAFFGAFEGKYMF